VSLQSSVSGVVSGTALGHLLCFIGGSRDTMSDTKVVVFGEGREPQTLTRTLDRMGVEVIGVDPAYPDETPEDIHFQCYQKARSIRGISTGRLVVMNLRSHAIPRDIFRNAHCDHLEIFDYPGCGGGLVPFSEDLVCATPLEDGTVLLLKRYKGTMSDYIGKNLGGPE